MALKRLVLLHLLLSGTVGTAAAESFDCVVDPSDQVKVGSAVTGVLAEVLVDRGDHVEAGHVIARLESSIEEASVAVDALKAGSNEDIAAAETRLALSKNKLERSRQLLERQVASAEQVEQLEAETAIGERALALEKLRKHLAELELARSQAMLDRRTILSPITGFVAERTLAPGAFVHQEASVATIVALDPLHVEAFVPVSYWGKVTAGAEAQVTLLEPIGGVYPARVTVVDRVFDAASGTFGVRLELPNPDNALPAGQRCTVEFALPAVASP